MDSPAEVPQVRVTKRPYPEEDEDKPQVLDLAKIILTFDLILLMDKNKPAGKRRFRMFMKSDR